MVIDRLEGVANDFALLQLARSAPSAVALIGNHTEKDSPLPSLQAIIESQFEW